MLHAPAGAIEDVSGRVEQLPLVLLSLALSLSLSILILVAVAIVSQASESEYSYLCGRSDALGRPLWPGNMR